mgnify:CR=1 FL=1
MTKQKTIPELKAEIADNERQLAQLPRTAVDRGQHAGQRIGEPGGQSIQQRRTGCGGAEARHIAAHDTSPLCPHCMHGEVEYSHSKTEYSLCTLTENGEKAVTNTVVRGTVEGFVNDEILLLSPLEFSK